MMPISLNAEGSRTGNNLKLGLRDSLRMGQGFDHLYIDNFAYSRKDTVFKASDTNRQNMLWLFLYDSKVGAKHIR